MTRTELSERTQHAVANLDATIAAMKAGREWKAWGGRGPENTCLFAIDAYSRRKYSEGWSEWFKAAANNQLGV